MQGTAKLHYVAVRVFRTLLSKGLCSDETEEGEGEGEGDIDGMKVSLFTKIIFLRELSQKYNSCCKCCILPNVFFLWIASPLSVPPKISSTTMLRVLAWEKEKGRRT